MRFMSEKKRRFFQCGMDGALLNIYRVYQSDYAGMTLLNSKF